MKLAVVGSRSITDVEWVFTTLDRFIKELIVGKPVILSGGAKGVDSMAKDFAKGKGYDFIEFIPYHILDKQATFTNRFFFTRNKQLIENADKVIAFWDGESTGTQHAIRYAQKVGVPVMVIKRG